MHLLDSGPADGMICGTHAARLPALTTKTHCYNSLNGEVVGSALHFIVDADIVICSENATFYDRHPEGGAAAIWEPIQLARKIPYEIALRMMLMGPSEGLNAQRAYEVGLVS